MFTSAECRERAEQKLKLAACDIRHRRRLTRAAHAWLILADREELLEAAPNIPRNRYSVASLIGRLGSSVFRLSTAAVSMSPTGSCFSSESAPRPFHHGIRRRGGTTYGAALPSDERQVQATERTHLIHRPARDIVPPLGGARVSFYCI